MNGLTCFNSSILRRWFTRGGWPAALLLLAAAPGRACAQEIQEGVEVLSMTAEWDVLMILQAGTNAQLDPVQFDSDFLATWNTPAYDGPAFRTGVTAPISYGGIDFFMSGQVPIGNLLDAPATNTRGAVYFRTTLDLQGTLTNAQLTFLADDGFILYVDGVRWASQNMFSHATSAFNDLAVSTGQETALSTLSLGEGGIPLVPIEPGRHMLHMSLHNNNPTSSDLGFLLRINGDITLPPLPPNPALAMSPSTPSTDGSPRILLSATGLDPAASYIVEGSTDTTHWAPLGLFPAAEARRQFTLDVPAAEQRRFFKLTNQTP